MKKIKLVTITIFLLLFLSSCFQIERVINVNKDGSGTIEETVLMSQDYIDQMKQMATSFGGGEIEENRDESEHNNIDVLKTDKNIFVGGIKSIDDLKKQALKMGEGVEYVSSKPLERDGKTGYIVIYSFHDITKIKINENPADNMMSSSGMGEDKEGMYFKLQPGVPELKAAIVKRSPKKKEIQEDKVSYTPRYVNFAPAANDDSATSPLPGGDHAPPTPGGDHAPLPYPRGDLRGHARTPPVPHSRPARRGLCK